MIVSVVLLLYVAVARATPGHGEASNDLQLHVSGSVQCNMSLDCSGTDGDTCPPGLFCEQGCCKCGSCPQDFSKCDGTSLLVADCFCTTFDLSTNVTSVGACIYKCGKIIAVHKALRNVLYFPVSRDLNLTCSSLNRTGVLCGRCLPDHYPLAYSFHLTCIPCPHAHWNWFRYIMAAYVPLTLFYFLVLAFKMNTTFGYINIFVCFCQSLSLPVMVRLALIFKSASNLSAISFKVALSLYGIWNLDFFRPFYSDLCLGIGVLPTLALDYVIAVYPLLLMVITYLLIDLYDKNYRIITTIWRPFKILFLMVRKSWNIKTSLVDAFATFFFLSNVKFLTVSFDLLVPTRVYQIRPNSHPHTLGLYYAGDIEYFGKEHLPYAILAIVVLCVFVLLPVTVLTLYPFQFFQKFLNLFPLRWYILHTFMDAFQGCYKDGTEPGTRDRRWFSSLYFIHRIIFLVIYSVTLNILGMFVIGLLLMLAALLFMILKPFKPSLSKYNRINAVFVQILAFVFFCIIGGHLSALKMYSMTSFFAALVIISGSTPFLYTGFLATRWAVGKRSAMIGGIVKLRSRLRGYQTLDVPQEEGTCDRIENSGAYPRENLACFVAPES